MRLHERPAVRPAQAGLKGNEHRLNDISAEGLGIIVDGPLTLSPGQRFDDSGLRLNDGAVWLTGIVTHITKNERNTVRGILFQHAGIEECTSAQRFRDDTPISGSAGRLLNG